MIKDEVKKLRMDSPESLQFLNNATKFYNLMMMYRCAIRGPVSRHRITYGQGFPQKVADSRLYQTAVKPAYKLQGHCASLNRNQDPFFRSNM